MFESDHVASAGLVLLQRERIAALRTALLSLGVDGRLVRTMDVHIVRPTGYSTSEDLTLAYEVERSCAVSFRREKVSSKHSKKWAISSTGSTEVVNGLFGGVVVSVEITDREHHVVYDATFRALTGSVIGGSLSVSVPVTSVSGHFETADFMSADEFGRGVVHLSSVSAGLGSAGGVSVLAWRFNDWVTDPMVIEEGGLSVGAALPFGAFYARGRLTDIRAQS